MAYDQALATRVRNLVAGRKGVTEKAMFGGLVKKVRAATLRQLMVLM